ncbi:MAG: hypothetical protein JXR86_05720 [Spirochaetales bacterium]|nr:hypothetical protein [Spirochaetales bacterium]
MAGLLEKAKYVREHLKDQEDFESIPESERQQISQELEKAVSRNKLEISEETFSFEPEKSDVRLPLIINTAVIILTIGLSLFFLYYFNRAQTVMVRETATVSTAEGRLIQAIREESEERLGEKNREIQAITDSLNEIRSRQEALARDYDERAARLEAGLRQQMEQALEEERGRLREEGLSEGEIDRALEALEKEQERDFSRELAQLREELETERSGKEEELKQLISGHEESLAAANSVKEQLRKELTNRSAENETLKNELEKLQDRQERENLAISSILVRYTRINDLIGNRRYDSAIAELDNLEAFINSDDLQDYQAVQFRKNTDMILISSLKRLVERENAPAAEPENEPSPPTDETARIAEELAGKLEEQKAENEKLREDRDTMAITLSELNEQLEQEKEPEPPSESERLLREVSKIVESGNELYNSGDMESARENYLKALSQIPSLETGLMRLQDIGESEKQEEKELILSRLDNLEESYTSLREEGKGTAEENEDLYNLLNTKILVKQVLASDPIKEKYSDLYEKMETYLEAYGREKEQEGREAALAEIVRITEELKGNREPDSEEDQKQQELFLRFLDNLKAIMELRG